MISLLKEEDHIVFLSVTILNRWYFLYRVYILRLFEKCKFKYGKVVNVLNVPRLSAMTINSFKDLFGLWVIVTRGKSVFKYVVEKG